MLTYYGHTRFKLLNGGINKWIAEGRPVSVDVPSYALAKFAPRAQQQHIALFDDVRNAMEDGDVTLLDVRSGAEWEGRYHHNNKRAGRLPNAIHIEWQKTLADSQTKVLKPAPEVRELLGSAGVTPDRDVITYCQIGIRAAHSAFVLRLLGYEDVALYDASMQEWANRDETPLEAEQPGAG